MSFIQLDLCRRTAADIVDTSVALPLPQLCRPEDWSVVVLVVLSIVVVSWCWLQSCPCLLRTTSTDFLLDTARQTVSLRSSNQITLTLCSPKATSRLLWPILSSPAHTSFGLHHRILCWRLPKAVQLEEEDSLQ